MAQPAAAAAATLFTPASTTKKNLYERIRKERAKYEFTLFFNEFTAEIKKEINDMKYQDLRKRLQKIVNDSNINDDKPKPKITTLTVLPNNQIRLQCENGEEVKTLRLINWELAIEGMKKHKRNYGVVIHGVPKRDINFHETQETIITLLKEENDQIPITKVGPLRRKDNDTSPNHSIVIFIDDGQVADNCIMSGIKINYRLHYSERYVPHLTIAQSQCYNCYGYGHRAHQCREERTCGKCAGHDHTTNDCTVVERKCAQCQGSHYAWHHECEERKKESRRLLEIKMNTSPYFTR
jgi:hypothetical protein